MSLIHLGFDTALFCWLFGFRAFDLGHELESFWLQLKMHTLLGAEQWMK